jgi:hypothetical protein
MLTFHTIAQALSANMTTLSLSSVCLQTDNSLIPIKSIMTGTQITDLSAITFNNNLIHVDRNWSIVFK